MRTNREALLEGSELVVISNDPDYNSAVFWMDSDGTIFSFSRAFGVMKRTDMTIDILTAHLDSMEEEGSMIFARGWGN